MRYKLELRIQYIRQLSIVLYKLESTIELVWISEKIYSWKLYIIVIVEF